MMPLAAAIPVRNLPTASRCSRGKRRLEPLTETSERRRPRHEDPFEGLKATGVGWVEQKLGFEKPRDLVDLDVVDAAVRRGDVDPELQHQ